eukprot:193878-Pyramimonas_sp.AAC.1
METTRADIYGLRYTFWIAHVQVRAKSFTMIVFAGVRVVVVVGVVGVVVAVVVVLVVVVVVVV